MTWPIDAIDVNYAAGMHVPSANLNQIQNRIVDLHRLRQEVRVTAVSGVDSSINPSWAPDSVNPEQGWAPRGGPGGDTALYFWIRARAGAQLAMVEIKYYNADPTLAAVNTAALYSVDARFSSGATIPSKTTLVAPTAFGNGALTWTTLTLTPAAADELGDDHTWLVVISGYMHPYDDRVAGVRVKIQPITPTP